MDETPDSRNVGFCPANDSDVPLLGARARRAYAARRRRAEIPGVGDLLADPAWDILLALFIAACEGRRKSAASACADAGVAESNALRWLSVLETQGLVVGRAETQSAREGFRSLSPATLAGMTDYFRHSCE